MYLPLLLLVRRIIGAICVVIGIIGLLMPILPGWPFLIPGIALLGPRDPILRTLHSQHAKQTTKPQAGHCRCVLWQCCAGSSAKRHGDAAKRCCQHSG